MNRDSHLLSEAYKTIQEQQLAGFGVSKQSVPKLGQFNAHVQQGVTPSLAQMNSAMQSAQKLVQGGMMGMDNMKANKLMDELMQDMGIDAKYKGELIKLAMELARKSSTGK